MPSAPIPDLQLAQRTSSLLDAANAICEQHRRAFFAVLLTCCTAYLAMTFAVPLAIPGLYANDMNQNLAWAWRLVDPGAFPGDLRVNYQQQFYGWPGLSAVEWVCLHFLNLEQTGELLALGLGAVLLVVAWRIGRILGRGPFGGAVAALALAAMMRPADLNLWAGEQGGMPRSFALPFLLVAAMAMLEDRPWLLAAALGLMPLFYPPAALLGTGTALLFIVARVLSGRARLSKYLAPAGACVAVLLAEGLWLRNRLAKGEWGEPPTLAQGYGMRVFQAGGMLPILPKSTVFGCWLATHAGFTATIALVLLLLGAAAFVLHKNGVRVDGAVLLSACFLLPGMAGYAAAYAFFFRLYHPSRYMMYGPVLAIWLLGAHAALGALSQIQASPINMLRLGRAARVVIFLFLGVCAANLWRVAPRGHDPGHTGLYRTPLPDEILAAIRALPESAVIAAPPDLASDIPFLCERSVYLQADDLFPYKMGYYAQMMKRLDEQEAALFASSWIAVEQFAEKSKVQYLLVDRRTYQPGYGTEWAASYPRLLPPALAPQQSFILLTPPASAVVASSAGFMLVRIGG